MPFAFFPIHNTSTRRKARVTFRVMQLGRYVIVDDGSNYVTYHELNVRIKNFKK